MRKHSHVTASTKRRRIPGRANPQRAGSFPVLGFALIFHVIMWCSPATLQAAVNPIYCESLPTDPPSDVVVTPNKSGSCDIEGASYPCRADQSFHVDVHWASPPTELSYVLRCTLANPEYTSDPGLPHCFPRRPAGCLARIEGVQAANGNGAVVIAPEDVSCDRQINGESHPVADSTFVASIDFELDNNEYCNGLAYEATEDILEVIPWAEGRCCRVYYDLFFRVQPGNGMTEVSFDVSAPLPALGDGDWLFVKPSCGDGVRNCGEQCDDAGTADSDGCSSSCQRESCGKPKSGGAGEPTASDALLVLRAAIGARVCDRCICDANNDGEVKSSDALRVLRRSVGQPVQLSCEKCGQQHNSAQAWDPILYPSIFNTGYCDYFSCDFETGREYPDSGICADPLPSPHPLLGCCNCPETPQASGLPYQCSISP